MKAVPKRNRRQWGWVELDKSTSPQTWKGRWLDWTQARVDANGRTRPKQRSVVLGYKTKAELPTKAAAQVKWDSLRELVMNPKEVETVPVWTFSEFVWKHYFPDQSALRSWRPATHEKFRFLMSKAEPVFGARPLGEITLAPLQNLLVKLAKNECHDTVKGMRSYLRAIFRDAREQEIIPIDPTRKLLLPQTRKPDRPLLTVDQIRLIEPRLQPRDQTILRLLTRCGLRPGEVFGLAPEDVGADRTVHVK